MSDLVHRLESVRHRAHVELLHLHLYRTMRQHSRVSTRVHVPFCVRVPVLSLSRYSILPNSSGRVLVRTIVLGISESVIICCAYTVLPISKLTRRLEAVSDVLRPLG